MTFEEIARHYYTEESKNCAETIFLATNDYYGLNCAKDDVCLFSGFGGGMGCGRLCGCLAAAIGILGKMYDKKSLAPLCKEFVMNFEERLGCGSTDCKDLAATYKHKENGCLDTVLITVEVMEKFVEKHPLQ